MVHRWPLWKTHLPDRFLSCRFPFFLTMKKFSEKPRLLIWRMSELLSSISVFKQHLTHLYWRHVFLILPITGLLPSGSNNEYIESEESRVLWERLESASCTGPSSYLLFSSFFSYTSSHCKRSLRFHGKLFITDVPSKNIQRCESIIRRAFHPVEFDRVGQWLTVLVCVGLVVRAEEPKLWDNSSCVEGRFLNCSFRNHTFRTQIVSLPFRTETSWLNNGISYSSIH